MWPNQTNARRAAERAAANPGLVAPDETGEPQGIRLMTDGREATLPDQAVTAIRGHGYTPQEKRDLENFLKVW